MNYKQGKDIFEQVLENAFAAIELGIEDFILAQKDPQRYQSSVRNLYAGILLLYKSKLAELSKDKGFFLLFEYGRPYNNDERPKTVGVKALISRLQKNNVNVSLKAISDLQQYRNDIEHYFSAEEKSKSVVGSYIANSFIIIKEFIEKELELEPQKCFSERIWREMLEEEKVHTAEIENKIKCFDQVEWYSEDVKNLFLEHRCSDCDSDLIKILHTPFGPNQAHDIQFECLACSRKKTYKEFAKDIINDFFYSYEVVNDLGRELIGYCPSCLEESYWSDGNICLLCGEKGPYICKNDGCEVPISELLIYDETGMCGYCAHVAEKIFEDDD